MNNNITRKSKIQLSLLKHDVKVGKIFNYEDGKLVSNTNGNLVHATCFRHDIESVHELEQYITESNGDSHFMLGVSKHSDPMGVSANGVVEGSIARSNKYFKFRRALSVMCIDSDNITHSIYDKLVDVCPAIGDVQTLEKASSSCNLYTVDTWLRKYTGSHIFMVVKNGRDIKRTLDVLHKRAILKGYSQHKISSVGGFLERSFIDKMLASPSQPIYLKPNLPDGVYQDAKIVKRDGEVVLDTEKYVLNLTEIEEAKYNEIIKQDQDSLANDMHVKRQEYLQSQPNRNSAEKAILTETLDGAFIIDVQHDGKFSVHDILCDPTRFHARNCRDPFNTNDGSYTQAKLYTDQNTAYINTFAHGGGKYRLIDPSSAGFGDNSLLHNGKPLSAYFGRGSESTREIVTDQSLYASVSVPPDNYPMDHPLGSECWDSRHVDGNGKPLSILSNFRKMIANYGIFIGYDCISKDEIVLGQGMTNEGDCFRNANISEIISLCELNNFKPARASDYIKTMMRDNEVNPVEHWVKRKPWDGQSRLCEMYDTLNVVDGNALGFDMFRKWCIGAYRVATDDNFHGFEQVLILQACVGGEGKTRWFNNLTPPRLHHSMVLNVEDKDNKMEALSNWLVELGEFDATVRKSDQKHQMGFLSRSTDKIRPPYAAKHESFKRRTAFMGTVNSEDFLVDDSGERRYWVLRVGQMNYNHGIDIQQFWAEIATLDEPAYFMDDDFYKVIEMNKGHKIINPVIDNLESYFTRQIVRQDEKQFITASELLIKAGIKSPNRNQIKHTNSWMKDNGFIIFQKRVNGIRRRGYEIHFYHEYILSSP